MIMLTDEERRKFSAYLKQEAESDRGIAEQLEKLHDQMHMAAPLKDAMSKKMKTEMAAKLIVASIIDRTESASL
jgi:hypothetical protein